MRSAEYEDREPSLWNTFNVVQENLVRGGLATFNSSTRRRGQTREVASIDGNTSLNRALWILAEEMRKL